MFVVFLVEICSNGALEITSPPQNTVALTGTTVQLTCGANENYENYFEWRAYIGERREGEQVYSLDSNQEFQSKNPKYHRLGDFGLEIDPVEWRDAAVYSCAFMLADVQSTANVVVMGQLKKLHCFFHISEL